MMQFINYTVRLFAQFTQCEFLLNIVIWSINDK